MIELNKIYQGDCIEVLKTLEDNSIDCCVTSPPYFGLRDYGHAGQIGLEETPELFVTKMVEVFTEVKRVLKKEGTLWLNLGDSYCSTAPGTMGIENHLPNVSDQANGARKNYRVKTPEGMKPKDLMGIPWMVAFALRNSGWYLRQDIIWHKPNPMPESVTDRCTKSHEYIFLLSKSPKYYYDADAIKTPIADATVQRMLQQIEDQKGSDRVPGKTNGSMKAVGPGRNPRPGVDDRGGNQGSLTGIKAYTHRGSGDKTLTGHSGNFDCNGELIGDGMANKKSVWTVTTKPFSEAHFATFPEDLIVDCIKAGTSQHGCCASCGKPYIKFKEFVGKKQSGNARGVNAKVNPNRNPGEENSVVFYAKQFETKGWVKSCSCDSTEITPPLILDPFMGAGTTALVARKLHRNFIGIELNETYINISNKRLQKELGMFI